MLRHGPYARRGRSPCDACIGDLRKHLPSYSKGGQTTFDDLWPLLDDAIANGRRTAADAAATGERNPSTEIHELVAHLRKLAES